MATDEESPSGDSTSKAPRDGSTPEPSDAAAGAPVDAGLGDQGLDDDRLEGDQPHPWSGFADTTGLTPEDWSGEPGGSEEDAADGDDPAVDHVDDLVVDQWAWVDEEPEAVAPPDIDHCTVTAVLVAMDADQWLAETLAGLARLRHRPHRIVAIDNASVDRTPEMLQRALAFGTVDAVYRGDRAGGFGAAVRRALRREARAGHAWDDSDNNWLWLLHDDAVPHPDALRHLLEHVVTAPEVDVTGPKLLWPGEGRRAAAAPPISELGVSISGTGRRELMLDAGEIDQGQQDLPRDVLGVSTCGLLVRARVWREVGGLDPGLPVFRDGVEFGWRCHRLGFRVVTTPRAEMTHRQVGRAGLRPRGAAGRHPGKVDRQLGLLVVAAHAHGLALPLVWFRLVVGGLLRTLGYVAGKAPGRARDELAAVAGFAAHPDRIRALRRRVAERPAVSGSAAVVRALRPAWWSGLHLLAETLWGSLSRRSRSVAGEWDVATLDELTGDDFAVGAEDRPRHPWLSALPITIVLTLLGSVVAARGLFGTGALAATAMLPAPALADLWRSAWDPVPGAPGNLAPPWLAVSAAASTLLAGHPDWFGTVLICLIVPLAVLSAYPLMRRTVADRRLRWWASLTYALLPVLLGGTNQGRLGLSVAALLLPHLAWAVRSVAVRRARTPEAWRGAWGGGAALAVIVAFEPAVGLVALIAGAAGAVTVRRTPRKAGRMALTLGIPVVLWSPWWISLLLAPNGGWGRLLAGPDAGLTGAGTAPTVWELLIGRETGPGLPPLLLSAVAAVAVWAAALGGLRRRPRHRIVLGAWTGALLSFGVAVAISRLVVAVPPQGTSVRPWTGSLLLVGFACLLWAAATGLDGVAGQVSARSFSWLQPAVWLGSLLAVAVTVSAAAWWMIAGLAGPVDRVSLQAVPPFLRNAMAPPARVRILAVELRRSQATYAVLFDDQMRWGDADRGFAFGAATEPRQQAGDLVLRLVAGSADEGIAAQLRSLGIGYVWVRGAGLVDQARIDNTPGLAAASDLGSVVVWPVEGLSTRARVVGADGATTPVVAAGTALAPGPPDRQLRLAEAADGRWWATLDGRPLPARALEWEQAFVVGESGGELRYGLRAPTAWLLIVQGALFAVVLVLAAPAIRRPEVRDPTRVARRAARVSGGP